MRRGCCRTAIEDMHSRRGGLVLLHPITQHVLRGRQPAHSTMALSPCAYATVLYCLINRYPREPCAPSHYRRHAMNIRVVLLLLLVAGIHAHGFMSQPRCRGAYRNDKVKPDLPVPRRPVQDFCAHCQNGGGTGSVSDALSGVFSLYSPRTDSKLHAGLCGDKLGGTEHMLGGRYANYGAAPIVAGYEAGGVADFEAELDTNHNGFFEFYLCNLDTCSAPDIDDACFKRGHCVKLNRVPIERCENPSSAERFECGPIDPAYPSRWIAPCRRGAHVGVHIVGGKSGTMRYRIPADVKCKHCVVQWYWVTANSCNPKGFVEYFQKFTMPFGNNCPGDGGARGGVNPTIAKCGGSKFPEEFWNCADVAVFPGASTMSLAQLQLPGGPPVAAAQKPQPTAAPTQRPPRRTQEPTADVKPTEEAKQAQRTEVPQPTQTPKSAQRARKKKDGSNRQRNKFQQLRESGFSRRKVSDDDKDDKKHYGNRGKKGGY